MRDLRHEPKAIEATDLLRAYVAEYRRFTNLEIRKAFPKINNTYLERARANLLAEGVIRSKRDGIRCIYEAI